MKKDNHLKHQLSLYLFAISIHHYFSAVVFAKGSSRPKTQEDIKAYKDLLAEGLVEPSDMELYICNTDGSDLRLLTYLGNANWSPFFRPNGKNILFSSNKNNGGSRNTNLFLAELQD